MDNNYKKLNNQPLQFVLAEFKYSPVLQMENFIPKIHDALRHEYPLIEKKQQQEVEVQATGVNVTTSDHWILLSKNKRNAVEVGPNRTVYMTSEYDRFEGFSTKCKEILDIVQEAASLNLMVRVGLRYGDLIHIEKDKNIEYYVDQQFSFPKALDLFGASRHQKTESFVKTDDGWLVVRSLYGVHDLVSMPDAQGIPITLDNPNQVSERMILDFDNVWETEPQDFDIDFLMNKLEQMHSNSRKAFWDITTEDAIRDWS